MLTKIRLMQVVLLFLLLALSQNVGVPWMANHGHFDFANPEFYPYLKLSLFLSLEAILMLILIFRKPSPNDGFYFAGKIILPVVALTLSINAYRIFKAMIWGWGIISSMIFSLQILVIIIALYLAYSFIRNKVVW